MNTGRTGSFAASNWRILVILDISPPNTGGYWSYCVFCSPILVDTGHTGSVAASYWLEYAGDVWKGDVKSVKRRETAQISVAEKIIECSKASSTAMRAELGMCPLKIDRHEKIEMAIKHEENAEKRDCQL